MGVFSLFPQTQAFSCWWNCCCCCHQEEPTSTVPHKKPLLKDKQRSEQQSVYGTASSQTNSLPQKPQPDSMPVQASRSLIPEERRDVPTIVTLLPSTQQAQRREELQLLLPSASLVTISLDSPRLEWAASIFKSASYQKIWPIDDKTYGPTIFGDEELPLALDDLAKAVFSQIPKQAWYTLQDQPACQKFLYRKVAHYTLPAVKEDVQSFVASIEGLWEENPKAMSFAYFAYTIPKTPTKLWLFFAQKGNRLLFMKTPCIKGISDEQTLKSQSATRVSSQVGSRASSRLPSPKKEQEERKVSVQGKKSSEKTNGTGNDSD